jgi:hypothetical protein
MSEFAEGLALGQSNNGGAFGNNGGELIWLIVLLAALGWGGNGSFGGNGGNQMGYDLGKVATTNDVASGFSTSTIMGNQRETQNMLYSMQNYVNQGFAGLNNAVMQVGYDNRFAIADLGYRLQDCCCKTQASIGELNYNMERNKYDVLQAFSAGVQRIVDLDTCRQLREQERYINTLERRASNLDLVNMLRPAAIPAYPACSPWETAFGRSGNNCF